MTAVQVRSQALRRLATGLHTGAFAELVPVAAERSASEKQAARGRWRQSDVRRAIAAAEQAGLASYRVEVAPDGTIAIIVGDPSDTSDSQLRVS